MSVEYYAYCPTHNRKVHIGAYYGGGFRLLTIGPDKQTLETWLTDHLACEYAQVKFISEHADAYWRDLIPEDHDTE